MGWVCDECYVYVAWECDENLWLGCVMSVVWAWLWVYCECRVGVALVCGENSVGVAFGVCSVGVVLGVCCVVNIVWV